ncbi:MAG: hypothetical protein HQL69_16755 [Magnetococcales bacterium]|nr:hypothetical protein [Magnetococcales bacterium]
MNNCNIKQTQQNSCAIIPPFDEHGNLPKGIHIATWQEFISRFSHNPDREYLLEYLKKAARELAKAGCTKIYVDGSYVTDSKVPGDYDMCWKADNVNPDILDPVFLEVYAPREAMKEKYRGDIFPEPFGDYSLLDYFQEDRESRKKGIIELDPRLSP